MTNLFDELQWRGLVSESTDGLRELFDTQQVTAYIGFDPTASSLHVGSLLTMMGLARLQRFGHSPIAIVGGGTGMIGDPKPTQERPLLTLEEIERNVAGIKPQLARLLDFDRTTNPARIVNNADWLTQFDLLGFLRDTGKYFTVNYMLQKESVSRRLDSDEGISFTEFSYLLLQARDYLELYDRMQCTLQMGGSDQWGNITAGIELIRKLRSAKAHGLVWGLLTTSSGTKFGKTEAGTIWLDAARTPPQEFRQFWLNTDDRDVVNYLKYFTFLSRPEIETLAAHTKEAPEKREAQLVLADHVSRLVHGDENTARVEQANTVLFAAGSEQLSLGDAALADKLASIADDVPSTTIAASAFAEGGAALLDLLVQCRLAPSKSEARRLVQQGGISVNHQRITDPNRRLTMAEALDGRVFLLSKGARQRHIVRLA